MTPLICAASSGHLSVVKVLLKRGMDPSCKAIIEGDALEAAARMGRDDVVHYFLKEKLYDRSQKRSALCLACMAGKLSTVKLLLSFGLDINEESRAYAPLTAACMSSNPELVEYLLTKGVPQPGLNASFRPALVAALQFGSPEVVRFVLSKIGSLAGLNDKLFSYQRYYIGIDRRKDTNVIRLELLLHGAYLTRMDSSDKFDSWYVTMLLYCWQSLGYSRTHMVLLEAEEIAEMLGTELSPRSDDSL